MLCLVENEEEAHEDRHLSQKWKTRRKGIGSGVFVESHLLFGKRLTRFAVGLSLVFLLKLLEFRLKQHHSALALDLANKEGN